LKIGKHINHIRGAVLQAPVSDREYLSEFQEVVDNLQLAQQLIKEGKEQHLMPPMQVFPRQAITAYRFHSLVSRFGDDDMFSSDFTDEELKQRLGHIKIPTLVVQSLQDEYIPHFVDIQKLTQRIQNAIGPFCQTLFLQTNHAIDNPQEITKFVVSVVNFVCAISPIK
jgi:pimeloyl-ACP methyl ester carboxylesterase